VTVPFTETFPFRWFVPQSGYEWQGGPRDSELHLIARGDALQVKFYRPLEKFPRLFRDFAALPPNRKGIREFASKYGDIYNARGVPAFFIQMAGVTGDANLSVWKQEIAAMRELVEIWDAINAGDKERLGTFISWSDNGAVGYVFKGSLNTLAHPDFDGEHLLERSAYRDLFVPARYALRREINKQLDRHPTIPNLVWAAGRRREDHHAKPDDRLRFVFVPAYLLAALWLQFAKDVAGGYELRQCAVCTEWFQIGKGGKKSNALTCSARCRQEKSRRAKEAHKKR
jgi:hypothetical protein